MATTDPTASDAGVGETVAQVLEFGLGAETYCLNIDCVDEIVDAGELTAIPNSPRHVEGVMDLRGRTTTIVDPKTLFGVSEDGQRSRIIVFDGDAVGEQGTVGWVVDEVYQVTQVAAGDVDDATVEDDAVRGIVAVGDGEDADDTDFVVWVKPKIEGDG